MVDEPASYRFIFPEDEDISEDEENTIEKNSDFLPPELVDLVQNEVGTN